MRNSVNFILTKGTANITFFTNLIYTFLFLKSSWLMAIWGKTTLILSSLIL